MSTAMVGVSLPTSPSYKREVSRDRTLPSMSANTTSVSRLSYMSVPSARMRASAIGRGCVRYQTTSPWSSTATRRPAGWSRPSSGATMSAVWTGSKRVNPGAISPMTRSPTVSSGSVKGSGSVVMSTVAASPSSAPSALMGTASMVWMRSAWSPRIGTVWSVARVSVVTTGRAAPSSMMEMASRAGTSVVTCSVASSTLAGLASTSMAPMVGATAASVVGGPASVDVGASVAGAVAGTVSPEAASSLHEATRRRDATARGTAR